MRLLFVSPAELASPYGGRAMLARLHRDALASLVGTGFAAHGLRRAPVSVSARIAGRIDGASPAGVAGVIDAIDAHRADAVWLDGSNLGRLAQAVRRQRPRVRVLTFCHNVEARFFLGALRRNPGARAAGVLAGNYVAERIAVRDSDDLVALSARDSGALARLYGRGADHLLPMAVADQLGGMVPDAAALVDADAPLLFVGGDFYANRAGIGWFVRKVAPRLALRVVVIGQGMAAMRAELERAATVQVVGTVGDLAPDYRAARAVIAPIFDGSGMKTKVAEAMMFGKRVIGTSEAWSGYDAIEARAGWRCDTADAFIAAIGAVAAVPIKAFDSDLRALYERHHSVASLTRDLAAILETAGPRRAHGPP